MLFLMNQGAFIRAVLLNMNRKHKKSFHFSPAYPSCWVNKWKQECVLFLLSSMCLLTSRSFFLSLLFSLRTIDFFFRECSPWIKFRLGFRFYLLKCVYRASTKMSLSELCYSLPLTAGEARWHLFLSAVRAHRWQTDCGRPGGQKPEEDGCRWSVRWVQFLSETVSWRLARR